MNNKNLTYISMRETVSCRVGDRVVRGGNNESQVVSTSLTVSFSSSSSSSEEPPSESISDKED